MPRIDIGVIHVRKDGEVTLVLHHGLQNGAGGEIHPELSWEEGPGIHPEPGGNEDHSFGGVGLRPTGARGNSRHRAHEGESNCNSRFFQKMSSRDLHVQSFSSVEYYDINAVWLLVFQSG